MLIKQRKTLLDAGGFSKTSEFSLIKNSIETAIKMVVHPPGSSQFTIYPQSGKRRGEGNGVKPIKNEFINHLVSLGWIPEGTHHTIVNGPGPFDASYPVKDKYFVVEWETGNISSSHRAVNKMALGILNEELIGGILILPTRELYRYLTDRIGNYPELEPYFPLWECIPILNGFLGVIAIEHDATSLFVPRIPKGTDGRAQG
jgi:hypothetical protein